LTYRPGRGPIGGQVASEEGSAPRIWRLLQFEAS